jgi:secreted trypsin-like serine protease
MKDPIGFATRAASSTFSLSPLLCGERVGVRGSYRHAPTPESPPHPPHTQANACARGDLSPQAGRGEARGIVVNQTHRNMLLVPRTTILALLLALSAATALPCASALGQTLFPLDDSQQAELLPDPYDDSPSFRGDDSKIVGGEAASRGAWPWQVAIYRRAMKNGAPLGKGFLFCGGSLVNARWVLTAAHCFDADSTGRYDRAAAGHVVVVEATNVLTPSLFGGGNGNGRKLRVNRIVVHEQWNSRSSENDIALLELASPAVSKPIPVSFAQNSGAAQAKVSAQAKDVGADGPEIEGILATVTGWGHLRFDDPKAPANLMQVQIPVVSLATCKQAYGDRGGVIDHRTLCAGEREGGRDACFGDSGGPLVVHKADAGYLQVGIVSWGKGCGQANFYGVYTRVSAFGGWMHAKTGLAALGEPPPVAALAPQPGSQPAQPPSATLAPPSGPKIAPGDRALLVGIDQYQNAKFNLKGSVNDVRNMHRLLTNTFEYQPEQIMTLTDAQATRANILKAFDDWLIRDSAPGARVFFYMSSHGSQVPDLNGDEADGLDETLVPYDTRVETQNGKKVLRNQIIDDEIDDLLKRIPDRNVTVVIDACHSGTSTRGGVANFEPGTVKCLCAVLDDYDPKALMTADAGVRSDAHPIGATRSAALPKQGFIERRDNVVAWSAVNEDQLALVDTEAAEPESVFTRRFIEGIALGVFGGDGRISHAKLIDYVRVQSEAYCSRHKEKCEAGLSPQLEARRDLLEVDVVTGRPPPRPQEIPQNVLVHDNSAGVAVDFVQGNELRLGQVAQFRVRTQHPGYLVLLDVTADGKVTQVFPNALSLSSPTGARKSSNLVAPGRPLLVPNPSNPYEGFEWEIAPPTGEGRLIAILSKEPIRAVSVPERPTTFDAGASSDLVAQIAEELLREPVIAGHVQKREWSLVQTPYRINP